MMVNQTNNSGVPWQSTIPQQMPWMNLYQPSSAEMRFGQADNDQTVSVERADVSASQHHLPTSSRVSPVRTFPQLVPTSCPQASNPFHPNMAPLVQGTASHYSGHFAHCSAGGSAIDKYQTVPDEAFCNLGSTSLAYIPVQPMHYIGPEPTLQQKRSSLEMEDELVKVEEPPTKQQLSENRLFKRFGSLQLDGEAIEADLELNGDRESSDSPDEDPGPSDQYSQGRKAFSRYVYLLFKDKKSDNLFSKSNSSAVDRLIREEREKLNKAVILWNPPLKDSFLAETVGDSDDDEELNYKDHKDFLRNPDDSIIITEVEDSNTDQSASQTDPDGDIVFEE